MRTLPLVSLSLCELFFSFYGRALGIRNLHGSAHLQGSWFFLKVGPESLGEWGSHSPQAVLLTQPVQVPKTSLFLAITVAVAAAAAAKTTKYSTNYLFFLQENVQKNRKKKIKNFLQPQHKVRMPLGARVKGTTHHRTLA